jgi:hypothetical protein
MSADDWLSQVETIVWRVTADDPSQHRVVVHPAEDEQRDPVAEFAVTHGLLLQIVVDDDEVDDMPYVTWSIEVPRSLHDPSDLLDVPARLAELVAHLRQCYPPFENWLVRIDEEQTFQLFFEHELREEYDDLIHAIEMALLPLRTEDAARVDTLVRVIGVGTTVVGTYHLYLAEDGYGWLLANCGLADATVVAGDSEAAGRARDYGLRADSPVLVLPRPDAPLFYAQITRGSGPGGIDGALGQPPDLTAELRWVSHSPEELAAAILAAAPDWLPQTPPAEPS